MMLISLLSAIFSVIILVTLSDAASILRRAASISGPVVGSNFPDPAILSAGNVYYAYGTTNANSPLYARPNIQVATSSDGSNWKAAGQDALPTAGSWQGGGSVWAPDVVQLDNGNFVLYYTDKVKSSPNHHCIGAATSSSPSGPFTPLNSVLICPSPNTVGGAIDPEGYKDPATGRRYVVYKVDGNSLGSGGLCGNENSPIVPTPIMLQEVQADGITLVGQPVQLLDRDSSDGPLIEAPAIHRSSEGVYFLFYSSHCYRTSGYNVKYATAMNIRGPYTKASQRLLGTGDGPGLNGPGGMDVIANGNMVVFHAIMNGGNSPFTRAMYTAQVGFNGKTAYIG